MSNEVRTGVATFVFRADGRFLVGLRQGSHGAGTWGLPGGLIEFGEDLVDAAVRETREETGLTIASIYPVGISTAVFRELGRHFVTILYRATAAEAMPEAKLVEPNKCAEWRWVTGIELFQLKEPLFAPLANFVGEKPPLPFDVSREVL